MADFEKVYSIKFNTEKAQAAIMKLEASIAKIGPVADKAYIRAELAQRRLAASAEKAAVRTTVLAEKTSAKRAIIEQKAAARTALINQRALEKSIRATEIAVTREMKTIARQQEILRAKFNRMFSMGNIGKNLQHFGRSMMMYVTAPIVAASGYGIKLAMDFEKVQDRLKVSLGESSQSVIDFSKTTLRQFGLADSTAIELAAKFGDIGTSVGLTQKEAAKLSIGMVALIGDLASAKNVGFEEAETALLGVYTGQGRGLKKLDVVMKDDLLLKFARENGIKKELKAMSEAERVQLRYQFVVDRTANAHGNYARNSNKAQNLTRTFKERMIELEEEIGKKLLPAFTKFMKILSGLLDKIEKLNPEVKNSIGFWAGLAAVVGPLAWTLGKVLKTIAALKTIFVTLGGATTLAAFGALLTTIVAIGAAFIFVYKHWNELVASWEIGITNIVIFFTKIKKAINEYVLKSLDKMFGAINEVLRAVHLPTLKIKFAADTKEIDEEIKDLERRKKQIDVGAAMKKDDEKNLFRDLFGSFVGSEKEEPTKKEKLPYEDTNILGKKTKKAVHVPYWMSKRRNDENREAMNNVVNRQLLALGGAGGVSNINVAGSTLNIHTTGGDPKEITRHVKRELDKRDKRVAMIIDAHIRGNARGEQ
jgi:hypothetical protein